MKASSHETSRYELKGGGAYVANDWSHYDIVGDGKTVVGSVSQRSGGGWVATLPIKDPETNRKIGVAYGRGETPDDALREADRKALEGIT
jgi:hypothetical protein